MSRIHVGIGFLCFGLVYGPGQPVNAQNDPKLKIERTKDAAGEEMSKGTYRVWENRQEQMGRTIELDIVILHATGNDPRPDPIFYMAGGPGQDSSSVWRYFANPASRVHRDLVFISQRGTGGSNPLKCVLAGNDDNVQGYLTGLWELETFRQCLDELQPHADLTQYSTPIAMDDINEIRETLGYEQINLRGGSYGTRSSLVYMRRHPKTVRTAILNGVAPLAFTNPLYHAQDAQIAFDGILEECAEDPDCHEAFGDLQKKFLHLRQRLEAKPVLISVQLPFMDAPQDVTLDWGAFASGLRTLMYYDSRRIPSLINGAFEGDYQGFAEAGIMSNRGIQQALAFGMLACVTCAEDLDRISEAMIVEATKDTFFGDARVRAQKAMCEFWPRSNLLENFGDDVSVDVPTLLLSGRYDPVTGPRWGANAASHLPNSLHVIAPGSHGVRGPCIANVIEAFLLSGTVDGLDVSCVETMDLGPFLID
ncbi:MAG: alpha/beta hydrolase [Planctomycetota bacterium]|nr:alpha/beta hydrolase [Planctomycetota bacterium]